MSKLKTLNDLFVEQLKDLYYAEKQMVKNLPKMAKKASSPELKAVLEEHLMETENQVERLEKCFDELQMSARGKTCPAMDGLVEEGKEIMEDAVEPFVRDAGLIAAAQKMEHYEIASYGCLVTYANMLGLSTCADLLNETLQEEGNADKKLTAVAETINMEAMEGAKNNGSGRR